MPGEGAAGLGHLHEAEHAFVHTRAPGGRDNDDRAMVVGPVLDRARDAFADYRAHGRGEESEIHHGDRDFVALDHSVTAKNGVGETGRVLVFFKAILVSRYALELEGVFGTQPGIAFDEGPFIQEVFDSFLGSLREMIIATRANALVLGELDLVHDLPAARAFLPESLRDLALFPGRLEGGSFENGHGVRRARRSRRGPRPRRRTAERARIRSGSSRWLIHRQSKAPASLARPGFFVNETRQPNFPCVRPGRRRFGWACNKG